MTIDYERTLRDIMGNVLLYRAIFDVVYEHNQFHREEVLASSKCGCHECGSIFPPGEIDDWCDGWQTALCPVCGIDKVIGDASGLPVTRDFLMAFATMGPDDELVFDGEWEQPLEFGSAIRSLASFDGDLARDSARPSPSST